ncbi:Blue-light-activated histidine kinase 1 [Roseivivax jejudonensis]|uniref:histidine kinase n=1 Tax=Roseivivax jejudonensis TaxID=1529041 RepID=A0A1X6Y6L9_9RHOB|nr:PAS domain S-box protein [Roseivivax jejudonensis]SLN12031.1 Blue-light-activated histidine kinase 1 [Roseivivax jejudonensis]
MHVDTVMGKDDVSALLRDVLDNLIAFVGLLDPEGRLLEVNEPALEIAGIGREDVIGRPLWTTFWFTENSEAGHQFKTAVTRARRGETVRFDTRARTAGNGDIDIDVLIVPRTDDAGNVVSLIASATDITDRKLVERRLLASHDAFLKMVTGSPFGILVVDSNLDLLVVSQGAQETLADFGDLIGDNFADILRQFWPPQVAEEVIGQFRNTLETGETFEQKSLVDRREDTGETVAFDWQLERVDLPDGSHGVVSYFYDFSEREQIEAALLESERMFRATFENAAVGVAHVAPDGTWMRVNEKLCEITGYTRAELNEMKFQDITHPEDLAVDLDLLSRVIDGRADEYALRKRYIRKDDEIVWVNLTVGCVRNSAGDVDYLISAIEDIDAQIATEAQRDILVQELHHRVKNILATIQSVASHTLRASTDLSDFRGRFMGRLQAISKAHDSIFDTEVGSAVLHDIVRDQFGVYYPDGLERAHIAGPVISVEANVASALGVIIHELLTNAMKYGALSVDGGHVHIEWRYEARGRDKKVSISWQERGGPPATEPTKKGFGSKLIEMMVNQTLSGTFGCGYSQMGMSCHFDFTVSPHDHDKESADPRG